MDATKIGVALVAQMIVPAMLLWQLHKSNRWCKRYEKTLERQHRTMLELIATQHGIPLIENETNDELFARMQRLQSWRSDGLPPRG